MITFPLHEFPAKALKKTILLAAVIFLSGCGQVSTRPAPATLPKQQTITSTLATATPARLSSPTVEDTAVPTSTSTPINVGPDEYPPGVNPLSGLPVKDPASLELPPALVSISNSPVTARPQAGLSFSPLVFETFIGAGNSRFLALFYGDPPQNEGGGEAEIGPVRSGRLIYEPLRKLYNGFLMFAFASHWVLPSLTHFTFVITQHPDEINGARVKVSYLQQQAKEHMTSLMKPALIGNRFESIPPEGGKPAASLWLPYSFVDQIFWRFDQQTGSWNRWQDQENGKDFTEISDSLNGKPLAFENIIILFADHHAFREELIDVTLYYIKKYPALLFRDGKVYKISWTTANEAYERSTGRMRPIRFIDDKGQPFPLKPGQTWVEIVTKDSAVYETMDTEDYYRLSNNNIPGSGFWAVQFSHPVNDE